jgi:chemotaxis methyl-accepting protein methylase
VKSTLGEIAELVRREIGITLTVSQETALRAALGRAAPGLDHRAFLRAAADPLTGRALVERLIDEVTIKETTFLRDRRQLDAITWHGLLEVARAAGSDTIRVWSAGCATGEEPYTLALLAAEAFGTAEPPVDILGTDVSSAALAAAAHGSYRERAVGALHDSWRRRSLERQEDRYVVKEELRRLVRFRQHNLSREPIPPLGEEMFDLVICRNVLIYFDAPLVERVIAGFELAVRDGGTLVIGAADALCGTASRLASIATRDRGPLKAVARLRRPLGRVAVLSRDERLAAALGAANAGRTVEALVHAAALLESDALDADAYFVRGLVELEADDATAAAGSLRRALYVDPTFALAAFTLGRAHDARGDDLAACRAYEQALRTLDPDDDRHELLLQQVDLGDVAAACRARLGTLRTASALSS